MADNVETSWLLPANPLIRYCERSETLLLLAAIDDNAPAIASAETAAA